MSQRVIIACKPKPLGVSEAKASLNRATKYAVIDPKRGDLGMGRLKVV